MVTQQILVLFFLVRIQVAQQKEIAQAIFFCICTFLLHRALEKIVGMKFSVAPDEIGKSTGSFEKPVG